MFPSIHLEVLLGVEDWGSSAAALGWCWEGLAALWG
jgi:hypothetical protein